MSTSMMLLQESPWMSRSNGVRRLPGETGIIDIIGFLRALKRIGYDGPVTPEPFDEKLRRMPIREAILKTSKAVNKVWSMASL